MRGWPAAGRRVRAAGAIVLLAWAILPARGDWLESRGGPQRTGCLDDRPGPASPKVLWVHKAPESFIAGPVPTDQALYVSGLGAFNTGVFHALAIQPAAPSRVLWSKGAPFLKRPTVCSPAVGEGLIIFGDGMHQTDGAVLHALSARTGRCLWQYPVPGRLVHLEGAPTLVGGRVFIGGGDAGVLCVDVRTVTLDGKPHDLPALEALIEKRWAELVSKYEQEKQKDPTFAIPPNEDDLPKPLPRLVWQAGKGKWHVDAPVALAGDRLLAGSAFLEEEKIGLRACVCVKVSDGSVLWETPLKVNPWGGPTVTREIVLVGCSSVRYDVKGVREAVGEVVALDLAGGKVRWRKDVPGGVLSSIAVKDDLAVFAATDGKVRAWSVATGEEKWTYDAAHPVFAAPAIAAGTVYVADLQANLHALALADGKKQWVLNVPADPLVQAPGMVFGSPVVHAGRVYLGTCNLEGQPAKAPCAVVCVGDASGAEAVEPAPALAVDPDKRTVTIPCRIAPRKLPNLTEVYPIEVIASLPAPRGQKAHETVVTFEVVPSQVHKALEGLGLKPGGPIKGEGERPSGAEVEILLELPGPNGQASAVPVDRCLVDGRTGRQLPPLRWFFTGSPMKRPDPEKEQQVYGADLSGTLATVFPVTDETVLQSNLTMKEEMLLKLQVRPGVLGAEGTPARLIVRPAARAEVSAPSPGPIGAPPGLPAFAPGPLAWAKENLVPPTDTVWLAPVPVRRSPEGLPRRAGPLSPEQAGADLPPGGLPPGGLPPLAPGSPPLPSLRRLLPAGPLVRAPSPDPAGWPLPWPAPPNPDSPDPRTDPTADDARRVILSRMPALRRASVPFLPLAIPDPFEILAAVRLRTAPPDSDPPAPAPDLPARPALPTKP